MARVKIEIGDKWGDGHGKHDTFIVDSSLDNNELSSAYNKGKEVIGLTKTARYNNQDHVLYVGIEDFCEDYELHYLYSMEQNLYISLVMKVNMV